MRFVLLFLAAFIVLQQAYLRARGCAENILTHTLNARPAAAIVNLLDDSAGAVAEASLVVSPRGGVKIKRGCEGFEVIIILLAAMLAYPADPARKLAGMIAGVALLYAINLARIVSLTFIHMYRREFFELCHLFAWQSLIIAAAVAIFLLWVEWLNRGGTRHEAK